LGYKNTIDDRLQKNLGDYFRDHALFVQLCMSYCARQLNFYYCKRTMTEHCVIWLNEITSSILYWIARFSNFVLNGIHFFMFQKILITLISNNGSQRVNEVNLASFVPSLSSTQRFVNFRENVSEP